MNKVSAYLKNNYFKILDVRKASIELNNSFRNWFDKVAKDTFHDIGLFYDIETKSSQSDSGNYIVFYSDAKIKDMQSFSSVRIGIEYNDNYMQNNHFSHYAYAGIIPKNKDIINNFEDFVIKNISPLIVGEFDVKDCVEKVRSSRLDINFGDDYEHNKITRESTLESLEKDLRVLCGEVVSLAKRFKP